MILPNSTPIVKLNLNILFVNSIIVRVYLKGDASTAELINRNK